ncbi:hypothetical protein GCM10010472_01510 [Pseudonocardia halophobica]|uniref:PrgI family protein n=1 Tax=Pseudonocardia halophobica TaxID=29401 RepID=A0A9W6L1K3_9PSEU|nr:SCO6880 family protein [Pseudonocardia halophobica]GLL10491.1 hypothetical protein GCM10017577_16310 [Pseudonocardia halophobica]
MSAEESVPRMYGNWRPARGWGIGSLSTTATVTLFLALLGPLVAMSIAPLTALPLAAVSALVLAGMLVRVGGTTAAEYLTRVTRFRRARLAGWTELSGGLLTDHPRKADLPGVLAPVVPVETDDGRGGRQCLLWDRRNGRLSAVLRLSPVGLDLADADQADIWVAGWGSLLADLGYHRLVTGLTVTIDTAPSGGTTISQHVARSLDRNAPALARRILDELVAATPATAAEIDARATVTIDPHRASPRPSDLVEACVETVRGLPAIENGLAASGVAVLGRADTGYLLGRIRAAFDPTARPWLAGDDEITQWADAGPIAASERWDSYRHDSGISVTWGMREAPRQSVAARVLAPLLAPGQFPRRVCLVYEPYPAEQAAAKVEAEITSGQIRRAWAERTRRDETQRDRDDRHRALQSAREEAEGAGVGRFTLYVTTTVTDERDLPTAVADVENRAGQAKIRLRRMRGTQAAAFAVGLGIGVDPVDASRHR